MKGRIQESEVRVIRRRTAFTDLLFFWLLASDSWILLFLLTPAFSVLLRHHLPHLRLLQIERCEGRQAPRQARAILLLR